MNCLITAGPTFEPLDGVRRLTNFSTGRLGCELAEALVARGCGVTLLLGECATWPAPCARGSVLEVERFTGVADLRARIEARRGGRFQAVFHAAAVGDFAFGRVFERGAGGELREVRAGKFESRGGSLLAELVPTPKLLPGLRDWFPDALLVGWKYEVDGNRETALARAREQIAGARTDVCVLNGPAYGAGFGWVSAGGVARHLAGRSDLGEACFERLAGGTGWGTR